MNKSSKLNHIFRFSFFIFDQLIRLLIDRFRVRSFSWNNMTKKKFKFIFVVKTSTSNNVEISIAIENQRTEKNVMTKNQKFERVIEKTTREHIKKSSLNDVNNSTIKKNSFRICRIINFVNYQVQNFNFHFTRFTFVIFTFDEIFSMYEQLFHAQFSRIFAQFTLSKVIDKVNRSELNEVEWIYESSFFNENFSKKTITLFKQLNQRLQFNSHTRQIYFHTRHFTYASWSLKTITIFSFQF